MALSTGVLSKNYREYSGYVLDNEAKIKRSESVVKIKAGALLGSVAVNDVPSLRVKAQSITKKSSQS